MCPNPEMTIALGFALIAMFCAVVLSLGFAVMLLGGLTKELFVLYTRKSEGG